MRTLISSILIFTLGCLLVPGGPASAGILLDENFDDGIADDFTVYAGVWDIMSGAYHTHLEGFELVGLSAAGSAQWNDYHFEGDILAYGAIGQQIVFRVQSPWDYYILTVRAHPYDDAWLQKCVGGLYQTLAVSLDYYNQHQIWHHFEIDLLANKIVCRWDGDLLWESYDYSEPFLEGGIGVRGYSGGVIQWQDVYFDNILVQDFTIAADQQTWGRLKSLYR